MAAPSPAMPFVTTFDAETGRLVPFAAGVARVTAPNASQFTFTGTNSFLLGEERVAVVDPGPEDPAHLKALVAAIGGRPVEAILLTHTHIDHAGLTSALQGATGAPVWVRPGGSTRDGSPSAHGTPVSPDRALMDGETLTVAGMQIEVIPTPGHAQDHAAFGLVGRDIALTGDHVMGWNSTVIDGADGSLADYFASLDRLIAAPYSTYLSGHGAPIGDGPNFARALKAHREGRNAQVLAELDKGARSMGQLLDAIYPHLNMAVRVLAKTTLTAHLDYLEERGEIAIERGLLGWRIQRV